MTVWIIKFGAALLCDSLLMNSYSLFNVSIKNVTARPKINPPAAAVSVWWWWCSANAAGWSYCAVSSCWLQSSSVWTFRIPKRFLLCVCFRRSRRGCRLQQRWKLCNAGELQYVLHHQYPSSWITLYVFFVCFLFLVDFHRKIPRFAVDWQVYFLWRFHVSQPLSVNWILSKVQHD